MSLFLGTAAAALMGQVGDVGAVAPDTSVELITAGDGPGGGRQQFVIVRVYRGVNTSTPMDVSPVVGNVANTGDFNGASITPVTSGALMIQAVTCSGGITSYSNPDSLTNLMHLARTAGPFGCINVGDKAWAGGAFDPANRVATPAGGTSNCACGAMLALRPANSGVTPVFVGSTTAVATTDDTGNLTITLTTLTGGCDTKPRSGDYVMIFANIANTTGNNYDHTWSAITAGYTVLVDTYSDDTFDANLGILGKIMPPGYDDSVGAQIIFNTAGAITFMRPPDWHTADVELIGGGGSGGNDGGGGSWPGRGGGGGQYAKYTAVDLTALAASFSCNVGSGGGSVGTSGATGTADSWFSAGTTAYAQGGATGANGTTNGVGGAGGSHAAVNGATVANGGNGGTVDSGDFSASGGGGAGGPSGAGGNGVSGAGDNTYGGSGGTANGGTIAGGATGGNPSNPGLTGTTWDSGTKGPGSGGAGGFANHPGFALAGGAGGVYGGAGGGGGFLFGGSAPAGGAGGRGIIVLTKTS